MEIESINLMITSNFSPDGTGPKESIDISVQGADGNPDMVTGSGVGNFEFALHGYTITNIIFNIFV